MSDWRCHLRRSHFSQRHSHTLHFHTDISHTCTSAHIPYISHLHSFFDIHFPLPPPPCRERQFFLSTQVEILLRLQSPTQVPSLPRRLLVAHCVTRTWFTSLSASCYYLCSYIILSLLNSKLDQGRSQMSTFLLFQQYLAQCTGQS